MEYRSAAHPCGDRLMMVVCGGRCRPEREFRQIFDGAGLSIKRVIATGGSNFILEGGVAGISLRDDSITRLCRGFLRVVA